MIGDIMTNPLLDKLHPYPFERLRALRKQMPAVVLDLCRFRYHVQHCYWHRALVD